MPKIIENVLMVMIAILFFPFVLIWAFIKIRKLQKDVDEQHKIIKKNSRVLMEQNKNLLQTSRYLTKIIGNYTLPKQEA